MTTEGPFASASARLGGVVVLTAVLTVASGGAPVWSPRGIPGLDRTTIVAALAVLFSVGLLLTTGWAVVAHRRAGTSLRAAFVRALPLALTVWVAIGLYGIAEGHLGRPPEAREVGPRPEPTRLGQALRFIGGWDTPVVDDQGRSRADGETGHPIPDPPLALIVGLVALSVGATAWVWRRAGGRGSEGGAPTRDAAEEPLDAAATHRAVVGTIAAMLRDPDPDTAVIGAYAHLLEALSEAGAPRRDHEGPSEHLGRVLGTVHVRQEPLRRLVTLFESARFSSRSLAAEHRARALEALEAVAEDLVTVRGPGASSRPARAGAGRPS